MKALKPGYRKEKDVLSRMQKTKAENVEIKPKLLKKPQKPGNSLDLSKTSLRGFI